MRVLTAGQMAAVDRHAIESLGIPGPVLMENAARGAVSALSERFPEAESIVVLAGPGNNGGDGLAMARHLDGRGYPCRVFQVLGASGRMSEDARLERDILHRAGIAIEVIAPTGDALDGVLDGVLDACAEADLIVDALFGTGLSRPLDGHFAAVVEGARTCGTPVLAVDLPSGLDGSLAAPIGPHLEAELTVTFAFPKVAHVLPPAADAVGGLAIVDLGLPSSVLDAATSELELLTAGELAPLLPSRPRAAHKGDFGHVLLVAGGPGGAGAAVLAARSAVRGGAGLVTVAPPAEHAPAVDLGSLESMTVRLPREADPDVQLGAGLGDGARETIARLLPGKSVLAIGPGLGTAGRTPSTVRRTVEACPLPTVLDADALNAYSGKLESLATRQAETVLTPHPGEMARLLETDSGAVQADRLAAVRSAAERSGATVVLKGRRTLIAAPGRPTAINDTGNPGMATGGTGDVLTGLIAALIGQGLGGYDAACLGVHVHGLAGDLAATEVGETALNAGDLIDRLGSVFARLLDPR